MNTSTLSAEQKAVLTKCEGIIKDGQKAFIRTALAIVVIEQEGLWHPNKNLVAYCYKEFDFTDADTSRYRNAGYVLCNLTEKSALQLLESLPDMPLPLVESQCRELATLRNKKKHDAVRQREVWTKTLELAEATNKPITARLIREVIGEPATMEEQKAQDAIKKECKAKLNLTIAQDSPFDSAGVIEQLAEQMGVQVRRTKTGCMLSLEKTTREKLLHEIGKWNGFGAVSKITIDFGS